MTTYALTPFEPESSAEFEEAVEREKLGQDQLPGRKSTDRSFSGYVNLLVMTETNIFRRVWQVVLLLLLIYTGTVFPFKLAFYDFAIPEEGPKTPGWDVLHNVNDILFLIDLFLCFFLSFRDYKGKEVCELHRIALRYLRTYFIVNLIACIPPELVGDLYKAFNDTPGEESSNDTDEVHQTLRISRLQRMSRLARLVRLARLTKLFSYLRESQWISWLSGLRSTRVFNFMAGLGWVCHIMSCGWYLCAALEHDWTQTWVFRRFADDPSDEPNFGVSFDPLKHWLNAIYWVLTVFTTVGFGDMYAVTNVEIIYAMFTMLVGAVANGIILSEVINVITEADQFAREISRQKALVQGFSQHVKLRKDCSMELVDWVGNARAFQYSYDREKMKDMFLGNTLPTTLTAKLPNAIFHGHLVSNRFITCACVNQLHVPSRFVVLVALAVNARIFDAKETVYHAHDHAWNIFLVFNGVFANVAQPSEVGGISEVKELLAHAGKEAFGTGTPGKTDKDLQWEIQRDQSEKQIFSVNTVLHSKKKKKSKEEASRENETKKFVPYQLFCFGNYFGDVELFRNRKGSRRTCVRCESRQGGTLLVLGRTELNEIIQAFPMSYGAWRVIAAQREVKRRHLLGKLKVSIDYEALAAQIIQWYVRERLSRKGKCAPNRGQKVWGLDPVGTRYVDTSGASTVNTNFRANLSLSNGGDSPTQQFLQVREDLDQVNERIDGVQREMKQVHNKLDILLDRLPKSSIHL